MYTRYKRHGGELAEKFTNVSKGERLISTSAKHKTVSHKRDKPFGNLLKSLDLDAGDMLLIALMFWLFKETGDEEFLILLAVVFLL